MQITDRIYGKFIIDSPVLTELITSKPMQRLKGISQNGVPPELYHLKDYTRYEHCIGVMLFLKSMKASEEEQIAGLLHDVSHTAFSHVIDFVVGSGKEENFQDEQHKNYFKTSGITPILQKYSFAAEKITDYSHFKLLEQDLPHLCADRVDYSLRYIPTEKAQYLFQGLTTYDERIVCRSKEYALMFAKAFLDLQLHNWGKRESIVRYRIFANLLRYALDVKIIMFDDFWKDDQYILGKMSASNDVKIMETIALLKKTSLAYLPLSKVIQHKKFRYIDPEFLENEKLYRLREADKKFADELEKARAENEKGILLPVF